MASNCNDLSMPGDNKLCKVNQISEDEDEDEDGDYTVIEKQSPLRITNSKNIYVIQNNGNDAEPNSTQGKEDVSSSNITAEKIKKILKRIYKNLSLPMAPWVDIGEELLLQDYFVQLELQDTKKAILLENIFIEEGQKREINSIYIEAPPGFGKTTFSYKLMTDWVDNEKYIQKFELAFLVILRYLNRKSVKTTLSKIVNQKDEDKIWKLINNEKTLIIFDGLDEIEDEEKSKIVELDFDGTMIITRRTGSYRLQMDPRKESKQFPCVERNIQFWDRRITITGIDERNRIEFLSRIFNQNRNWSMIKTRIDESKYSLSDLFKSPLMLILLVYVLSENPQLNINNITKTELYKNLINCLIIRSQSKSNENVEISFNLFSDLVSSNDKIIEIFNKFGLIALEHLKIYNLQFEENEIVEKIYEMGLLIKHETKEIFKTTKVHYEALHLSVIEFAVALSLWLSYKKSEEFSIEQLNIIKDYIFDKDEESLVVPFLCGLMGEKVNKLFNKLKPHCGLLISGDISFLMAECHKNDLFGEAISPFIPPVLRNYTISNELWQLIEYGIQFKKLKYILIDINYFEYLPFDLTGANVQVRIDKDIINNTIVKRKCNKINFCFVTKVSKNTLEFILNTFNIIDCEIKKIEIDVRIVSCIVKLCLENKWIITKLDELKFCSTEEIRKKEIIAIDQFISLVTENCRVENLEVENVTRVSLGKIINSTSKLSFLKSVNIYHIDNIADLNLISKFYRQMSLDLLCIESFYTFGDNQITIFPHLDKILCKNKSVIQKISNFLNQVRYKKCRMTFNENCLRTMKMLKSEIAQSSSGFDSIIQLGFKYSELMHYKDRDLFFKSVTKCKRVETITFYFSKINHIIDFMKEYQNVDDTIFSKVNLIIEKDFDLFVSLDFKKSELEQIIEMMKIKRVKTLVLYTSYIFIEFWCQLSLFSPEQISLNKFLFQLIRSGKIDDLEIHIDWDYTKFNFFLSFDDPELELVWGNCDQFECSFNITRKCKVQRNQT